MFSGQKTAEDEQICLPLGLLRGPLGLSQDIWLTAQAITFGVVFVLLPYTLLSLSLWWSWPNLTLRKRGKMVCVMMQELAWPGHRDHIHCISQVKLHPGPSWGYVWCQLDLFLRSLSAAVTWGFQETMRASYMSLWLCSGVETWESCHAPPCVADSLSRFGWFT